MNLLFDLMDEVVEQYYKITHAQLLLLDRGNLLTAEELNDVIVEALEHPKFDETPNKLLVASKLQKHETRD